ncbi:MAG: indole-3-glycerol phosphate synthase TrpC [Elusimicrobiota bacterium]|nr:indole-3-glycerol phosphate synthase TrpC [Elusimicrobiota bacterium]
MFLEDILNSKKEVLEHKKKMLPVEELKNMIEKIQERKNFKLAISNPNKLCVIGELKKGSPSAGIIRDEFDIVKLAKELESAGVVALSILTEEKYFFGDLYYIPNVGEIVKLPILRKDFIVDEYQIYESSAYGADAVLLISEILSKEQLKDFILVSKTVGLEPVVEFHNESELTKVIESNTEIVAVNNRNLNDFIVDLETTIRLRPKIPDDKIVISESGIKSSQDINRLKEVNINAVLIGETLMRAENIKTKLVELGL